MSRFEATDTIRDIIVGNPALARVFEEMRIDYCCGGKRTLQEASESRGVDPNELLSQLEQASTLEDDSVVDPASLSLTELADHIEEAHHAFLRSELVRIDEMTDKVVSAHGERDPRLRDIRDTFLALRQELTSHMMKEEEILFPFVRQLEAGETPQFGCGSIQNPIRQMEHEHDIAGAALARFRSLTDDYTPPAWACNTVRALFDALAYLERDMHQHIHKENNVLFPRAMELAAAHAGR